MGIWFLVGQQCDNLIVLSSRIEGIESIREEREVIDEKQEEGQYVIRTLGKSCSAHIDSYLYVVQFCAVLCFDVMRTLSAQCVSCLITPNT